jgi:hypothetical protein
VITSSIFGVLDRQRYGSRPDVVRGAGVDHVTDELVAILVEGLRA